MRRLLAPRSGTIAGLAAMAVVAGCSDNPDAAQAGAGGAAGAGQGGQTEQGGTGGVAPLPLLEVQIGRYTDVGVPLEPINPGQVLTLKSAVQGGYVAYVAPMVRGLTSLNVSTRARVRDPVTRYLLLEEGRTPVMKPVADDPSWLEPDLNEFRDINHLVLCPQGTDDVILNKDLLIELSVTELDGDAPKTGMATVTVQFACTEGTSLPPALRCPCQCAPTLQKETCINPDGE